MDFRLLAAGASFTRFRLRNDEDSVFAIDDTPYRPSRPQSLRTRPSAMVGASFLRHCMRQYVR
jgi:hypothetical protein